MKELDLGSYCPIGGKHCKVYKKLGKPCGKKKSEFQNIDDARKFCEKWTDCDFPFDVNELESLIGPEAVCFMVNSGLCR